MNEKIQAQQQLNILNQANKETTDLIIPEQQNEKEIEELIPNLPKFNKIYDDKDMNLFKEDILNYLKDRDKCIYELIRTYKEKMEKTESNYLELTKKINNNFSDVLSSQAEIKNRLDKLNNYESFSIKTNDQLISHEIRINNLREDFHKSTQKYDKIYLENLELPGYIGKYSKYKNCQVFFEEVIKELNKLNAYKEKNTLDLKTYKEKLELNIKTFKSLVDNNNKSQIQYINEMYEKNFKECKNMIDIVSDRITDMRVENSKYAVELIGKSINLTKEWDKIQGIKDEIMQEFNNKIREFKIVSNNTIDSVSEFKTEFSIIKRKFLELAEFIRDVRFRKNIGGDIKKKEIKSITKKIIGKKSCGKSIDKEKEKILMDFNYRGEKTDIRQSVSQESGGKIKNYIKGVTNAEELKQDSKSHNLNNEKDIKKNKAENKTNITKLNIKEENNINIKRHKSNTVVDIVHNLRNLKKENMDLHSEESENSENNSISNIVHTTYNNKNNSSAEGIGSNKTNYGTNSNSNNRYLFKDILIDAEDKIINELASDLEQTNNKVNDNKEKNDKIQTLINKIEPMNINMNINKIENLNYNNNERNKEQTVESKNDTKSELIGTNKEENNQIDNIIFNFDKKLTNIEVYTKEKIKDLIGQMENLRQLFLNTNKTQTFNQTFGTNTLFKYPSYSNMNTNTVNKHLKMKEAHIVEIGGKILQRTTKIPKKYISNSNNVIAAKDKENIDNNSNRELNVKNKTEINLPKDLSQRIKTGKPPTSIKSIINRTLGANYNTIIFNKMANDFNNKFLRGIENKNIKGNSFNNSNNFCDNKINNTNANKYIDINKMTSNICQRNQNEFKSESNILMESDKNIN